LVDKRAVELLFEAVKYENVVVVRGWAASALGWLGDKRAVEPLIAVLKDEDITVRRGAVEALKKLGIKTRVNR
jgi:HEAT repeat protein